jgi:hypothetical protein
LNFDAPTKRKLTALNRLFPVVVAFPALSPLVPGLCGLPLITCYTFLNLLYSGYCMRIKIPLERRDIRHLLSLARLFIKKWRVSISRRKSGHP